MVARRFPWTLLLGELPERFPGSLPDARVGGREPRTQARHALPVALGNLTHCEDRRRLELTAVLDGESPQPGDRDIRVLVQTEDVLQHDQPLDQRPRPARVRICEKLERVPKSLAVDPYAVELSGIGLRADPVAAGAKLAEPRLEELGRGDARRLRCAPGQARSARPKKAPEPRDECLVAA